MLRIGDFARLGGVTVRALRHYDAEKLLSPAQVDQATGYRFYRTEQLGELDRIVALRALGFPLAEVRALLDNCADARAVAERLGRHRQRLTSEMKDLAARLRRLDALRLAMAQAPGHPAPPELSVRVRAIADQRALALRARVPSLGAPVTALFEEAEARAVRDRADRSPFLLFHAPLEIEACIPVRASCRERGVRLVAGAPLAGSITYAGSYSQAATLHSRLLRWLKLSGLSATGPLREVYHRFGADQRGYTLPARRLAERPDQYVTELQVPAQPQEDDA